jgi:uncharacterized membrane protein YoaK (UPF0700 family)
MKSPVVLHPPESVLTLRHGLSWMLLALSAGAINAGAFVWASSYVTHVTGALTRVSTNVGGAWSAVLESGFLIVTFVLGATASVVMLQARAMRGLKPNHAVPLWLVAGLVAAVALVGRASFTEDGELVLLGVLGFAMGLMNASVASSTALSVRTTHMTGPASDLGVSLGMAFFATGEERSQALRLAALRGGKVLAFIGGGLLMWPLVEDLGSLALLVPASLIFFAAQRSFAEGAERAVNNNASLEMEKTTS